MKKKRFSEEQIIGALKEVNSGMSVAEVCRGLGVSECTYYYWRKKYGGMQVNEAKRIRELEAENSKLKRIVADQAVDIIALKDVLSKNW
jgi:putative transposase